MTYQCSLDVPPPGHDGLQRRVPDSGRSAIAAIISGPDMLSRSSSSFRKAANGSSAQAGGPASKPRSASS